MGIFGDIAGGIGDIIKTGAPYAAEILAQKYAPQPIYNVYAGGGPPAPTAYPTPSPFTPAGGGIPIQLASSIVQGPVAVAEPETQTIFGQIADYLQGQSSVGFYRTAQTTRPVQRINMTNPAHPEKIDTWLYAGRPVLYSGDLRACRRVNKIARRARVRRGGR